MTTFGAHALSAGDQARLIAAERAGSTFLAIRVPEGGLRLVPLDDAELLSIGRVAGNDLVIGWDPEVSRVHARLERTHAGWTVVDDGLSRNGTFVGRERVTRRHRLRGGEVLRVGRTALHFRAPGDTSAETASGADVTVLAALTPADIRVLTALCRPLASGRAGALAPGNREIAAELHLSVDGVKARIRSLFVKLAVEDLPHHHKRAELARRALAAGLVAPQELSVPGPRGSDAR